jgi:hypothetical protein
MPFDDNWEAERRATEWIKNYIGAQSQIAFETTKEKLALQFKSMPSNRDIIWALFNSLTLTALSQKDYFHAQAIYYQMAVFLGTTGRNPNQLLKAANQTQLLFLRQKFPDAKVHIMGGEDSCDSCKTIDNQVYTYDEALKLMPLPHKECSYKLFNYKHSFCRCSYVVDF